MLIQIKLDQESLQLLEPKVACLRICYFFFSQPLLSFSASQLIKQYTKIYSSILFAMCLFLYVSLLLDSSMQSP